MTSRIVILFVVLLMFALPTRAQEAPTPIVVAQDVFERAVNALSAGEYQRAMLDASLFILFNPTTSLGYFARSQSYYGQGDLENTMRDLDRAILLSINTEISYRAGLYATRADIFRQLGLFTQAIDDYGAALDLNPTLESFASRGIARLAVDEYAAARDDFAAALRLQPNNASLLIYRALASSLMDEQAAAAEDYLAFFRLIEVNTAPTGRLSGGDVVGVRMSRGAVYRFTFEAQQGQLLSALAARQTGNIDPLLVITDADGNALVGSDDGAPERAALVVDYPIPADGTYTLIVGHSLGGFDGEMVVTIDLQDPA